MYSSSVASSWRKIKTRNCLIGSKCDKCNTLYYPIKNVCKCENTSLSEFKFSGKGEIVSFSEIQIPPVNFEKQIPYTVAIIKLEEGPRLTSQIVDFDMSEISKPISEHAQKLKVFDKIKIGMKVEACLRKIYCSGKAGIVHYGVKFRPIE